MNESVHNSVKNEKLNENEPEIYNPKAGHNAFKNV